jgi:hypothetical protein
LGTLRRSTYTWAVDGRSKPASKDVHENTKENDDQDTPDNGSFANMVNTELHLILN